MRGQASFLARFWKHCSFRAMTKRVPPESPPPAAELSEFFAVAAPGLPVLIASELKKLGIECDAPDPAGVAFRGGLESLYRANIWLRTATRVIVRLASFHAESFADLERNSRRVPWALVIPRGATVQLRVTCKKSRLYHSGAVAQRVADAIVASVSATVGETKAEVEDAESENESQLIVVRLFRDRVTISADSSGALLHLRGYRQAVAKAPLRETLAAAMLMGAEWDGTTPLLDPMCGSGTLPIEAALIARNEAPGLARATTGACGGFAFKRWPSFDSKTWGRVKDEAIAFRRDDVGTAIRGSDRDAGAIQAAQSNAERAGVGRLVEFSQRAVSAAEPPEGRGVVVCNPPYGVRVGERDALRNLYASLGAMLRRKCPGWTLAMLSPGGELDRQIRIPLAESLRTTNGGIPVRLGIGRVPESDAGEGGK